MRRPPRAGRSGRAPSRARRRRRVRPRTWRRSRRSRRRAASAGRQPSDVSAFDESSCSRRASAGCGSARDVPANAPGQVPVELAEHVLDGRRRGRIGPEVPGIGDRAVTRGEARRDAHVAGDRVQHVQPRPGGLRTADLEALPRRPGPHGVRHETIERPVPAADHVARAGRRHERAVAREERRAVGAGDELRTGLAGRVRVGATERVVLPVTVPATVVAVALVGGHDDDRAGLVRSTHGFEHVGRPEHVRLERRAGARVRAADERLGGQVEHGVRPALAEGRSDGVDVAHVALVRPDQVADRRVVVQEARLRITEPAVP